MDSRINPLTSLAPELASSGVRLPPYFEANATWGRAELEAVILRIFGITADQRRFLLMWTCSHWFNPFPENMRFELVPRDRRFAIVRGKHGRANEKSQFVDRLDCATIVCEFPLPLWASTAAILKELSRDIHALKRHFGLNLSRPDKKGIHRQTFFR